MENSHTFYRPGNTTIFIVIIVKERERKID